MNQPVARHGSDEATHLVRSPAPASRPDDVAHLPQGRLAAADIADDMTLRGPLGSASTEPDAAVHDAAGAPDAAADAAAHAEAHAEGRAHHAVSAYDLQLHGPRGLVYGPVDLEVPAGELVVLQGPQGAGRSSLLLTLAGRMAPDRTPDGWLVVLGENLTGRRARRRAVQRRAAIAGFHGIDELDDAVTVGDSVRERLTWLAPWYRRTPKVTPEVYERVARPVFGPRELPALDAMVWDLDEVDAMLLRIAIAMAQGPELLVVDDLDQVHDSARRQIVWERLEALAATGVTVIGSVASAGEVDAMRWGRAPHVVRLATGPQLVAA